MRHLREAPTKFSFVQKFYVVGLALTFSLVTFLLLPFIQALTTPQHLDLSVREIDSADSLPPPPPPPEIIKEDEPPPERPPPDLQEEPAMLDLAELELSLNSGLGGAPGAGEIAVKLESVVSPKTGADALFNLADLDQQPRPIYQPSPVLDRAAKMKTPGSVVVLFIVDIDGKVSEVKVQKSSDPALEGSVLAALKKWKFEPGQRNGKPVRFRMRVPITFPRR